MFIGIYTIPVLVTYMGLISSVISCICAINGSFDLTVIFFVLAGIFDLFDGMVARKLNKKEEEKIFGIQIDSIIDVVSFAVTPTIIAFNMGFNTIIDYVIFLIYIITATMRLAYFNYIVISTNQEGSVKYYTGLPVTYSALIFPTIYLLRNIISLNIYMMVLRLAYILVSLLFILNIKIIKPKGIFYVIFPLLAIIYCVCSLILL